MFFLLHHLTWIRSSEHVWPWSPPPVIIHAPSPQTWTWWNDWHVEKAGGGLMPKRSGREDRSEETDQKWKDVWWRWKRRQGSKKSKYESRMMSFQLNDQDEWVQSERKELLGGQEDRKGSHVDVECFRDIPAEGGVPLREHVCGNGLAPAPAAAAANLSPSDEALLFTSTIHSHTYLSLSFILCLFIMLPFNFLPLSPSAHLLPSFLSPSLLPSSICLYASKASRPPWHLPLPWHTCAQTHLFINL